MTRAHGSLRALVLALDSSQSVARARDAVQRPAVRLRLLGRIHPDAGSRRQESMPISSLQRSRKHSSLTEWSTSFSKGYWRASFLRPNQARIPATRIGSSTSMRPDHKAIGIISLSGKYGSIPE